MAVTPNYYWDIAVSDRYGNLVLIVELKAKTNVSAQWVSEFRRSLLEHGSFPKAPYFLIAFPDQFFLWTNADAASSLSNPNYTIDGRPILQPYCERAGVQFNELNGHSLAIIISAWLTELIYGEGAIERLDPSQPWLIESGLYSALAGGKLEYEAVA